MSMNLKALGRGGKGSQGCLVFAPASSESDWTENNPSQQNVLLLLSKEEKGLKLKLSHLILLHL